MKVWVQIFGRESDKLDDTSWDEAVAASGLVAVNSADNDEVRGAISFSSCWMSGFFFLKIKLIKNDSD